MLCLIAGCSASDADLELVNVSYDPTRELYQEINQAFCAYHEQAAGQRLSIRQTHGGSGAQARSVIEGLQADVVTLGLAGDINAIAKKELIAADWEKRLPNYSCPYTSTIVFMVRKGNPKNIRDWPDLVRPDVRVITPNPKISGGARWNFLAAWGYVTLHEKKSEDDARAFVRKMFLNVPKLDSGARGAGQTFGRRHLGDVFLSWENEAILTLRESTSGAYELVYPSISIRAEPPVSVVDSVVDARGSRAAAEAYLQFLYSPEAQEIIGKNGYRPSNPEVARRFASELPDMPLFSIRDLARDWATAQKKFFADGGVFDQIYQPNGAK